MRSLNCLCMSTSGILARARSDACTEGLATSRQALQGRQTHCLLRLLLRPYRASMYVMPQDPGRWPWAVVFQPLGLKKLICGPLAAVLGASVDNRSCVELSIRGECEPRDGLPETPNPIGGRGTVSVILAVISRRNGVVASDGRLFGSVKLQNDRPVGQVPLDRDDFDKTFPLCQRRVVGAFAGLTCFGGKTIAEHVAEIVKEKSPYPRSLEQVVNALEEPLFQRISAIPSEEAVFPRRKVDLLLAGRKDLNRQRCQIAKLMFWPDKEKKAIAHKKELLRNRAAVT